MEDETTGSFPKLHTGGHEDGGIFDEKGHLVADCLLNDEYEGFKRPLEEKRQFARLFAAAPELLEALERIAERAEMTYPHFEKGGGLAILTAARTAIAKAKGEQP